MSESRIQNAFARTTILTVGRLLLFVVAGFAIGLVIGVASEEPELLAGHVRGDTTAVELDEGLAARARAEAEAELAAAAAGDATGAGEATEAESATGDDYAAAEEAPSVANADVEGLPDVSAGPTGFAAARRRVEEALGLGDSAGGEGDAAAVEPAPATDSGASAGGGWAIQVGAFGDEPSARSLESRLEGKGYPIEVLPAGADSNRWRVRVQPIGEEQVARDTAQRIEREEGLPIWVIRLAGQPRE